jgi:hypothetical protein
MYMHHRDRELAVLKVTLEDELIKFDQVFHSSWRNEFRGEMPVKKFVKFILAREQERKRLEKKLGIKEEEEYQSL